MQGRYSQALFSGVQWWEERQWAQAEIQEILFKHEGEGEVFTVRVLKLWQKLPREGVEFRSVEMLKIQPKPSETYSRWPWRMTALDSLQSALKPQLLWGYTK